MAGFESILKSIGLDVLKGAKAVISGPSVIIQSASQVPVMVNDLKAAYDVVKTAEGMFAAAGQQNSGSAKLAAAQPYIATIVKDVEIVGGTTLGSVIKDEVAFNNGVADLTSALVKIANACGK